MELRTISLFFFFLLFSCTKAFSQSITLTANKNHIRVDKVGTVTFFYGEDANNRLGVTYYPNGTCYIDGYILEDGSWIRGTSEGRYYIKNNILYVT